MGCKASAPTAYAEDLIKKHFDSRGIKPSGRLQFFFHSPSSALPVRDVCNEQGSGFKTEPQLERDAENYFSECYQKTNIQGLLKNREKYLFLFTTCKNKADHMEKHFGERYIVGYICADRFLPRHGFIAVQGKTKIVAFEDAYPLERLVPSASNRHIRVRKLSVGEAKTQAIEQEAEKCPAAERLQTHPGVGALTALAFVLIIGRADRFECGKQIASYLGLVPSEESSGQRGRLGHITKQGNSLLRFLLVEAAQVTVRGDQEWRNRYFHLVLRRGRKIAKVAMARRLAVRLYWMWRKGWNYEQLKNFGSHAGEPGNPDGVQSSTE